MEIRKLTSWQEWFESDRIIGTAFLHGWNEKEAEVIPSGSQTRCFRKTQETIESSIGTGQPSV